MVRMLGGKGRGRRGGEGLIYYGFKMWVSIYLSVSEII